jgi:hypothetical protein
VPFPFDPNPSTLWTLTRESKVASCEVRFVPIGVEMRMLRDGRLLWAQTFESGEEALGQAAEYRVQMIANDWIMPT